VQIHHNLLPHFARASDSLGSGSDSAGAEHGDIVMMRTLQPWCQRRRFHPLQTGDEV
jgi:hypothetical protein